MEQGLDQFPKKYHFDQNFTPFPSTIDEQKKWLRSQVMKGLDKIQKAWLARNAASHRNDHMPGGETYSEKVGIIIVDSLSGYRDQVISDIRNELKDMGWNTEFMEESPLLNHLPTRKKLLVTWNYPLKKK